MTKVWQVQGLPERIGYLGSEMDREGFCVSFAVEIM
jgi:hypothetical protein